MELTVATFSKLPTLTAVTLNEILKLLPSSRLAIIHLISLLLNVAGKLVLTPSNLNALSNTSIISIFVASTTALFVIVIVNVKFSPTVTLFELADLTKVKLTGTTLISSLSVTNVVFSLQLTPTVFVIMPAVLVFTLAVNQMLTEPPLAILETLQT